MVRVDRTRNALLVAPAPQLTLTTSIGLTSTTRETAVALSVVQVNCPILHITITQINLFFLKFFTVYHLDFQGDRELLAAQDAAHH